MKPLGLGHRLSHYPSQLSGGEQQRVALARAIVHDPEILFADEPTGNLDGATGAQVVDLLFALKARCNATLFLVTHEEALAHRCDRTLRMKDGLIVADSAVEAAKSDEQKRAVPGAKGDLWRLAGRFARRDLRSGLAGFRIFLIALTLGVAAIAGVGSLGDAFLTGLAEHGRAFLGGDVRIQRFYQPATARGAGFPVALWPGVGNLHHAKHGDQPRRP